MESSCLQILDKKIWLSSEISDPKTWHAHPRRQTWQVPPGVVSRAHVCSVEQRARKAHDQNKQTLEYKESR